MEEDRLPHRVYSMMLRNLEDSGKWVSKVRKVLCNNNLEHIWSTQHVENERGLLCRLRESMVNNFKENWCSNMQNSNRFVFYRE